MRIQEPAFSVVVLLFTLAAGGAAEARHHWRYDRQRDFESVEVAKHGPALHGRPLNSMIAQFIRDCERQATELKYFPADEIARSGALNDTQANALSDALHTADEVSVSLARTCPRDVPADPVGRLDAVEHGIDSVEAALDDLQPALKALYGSLADDQKARLVRRFAGLDTSRSGVAETSGSADGVVESGTRRRSRRTATYFPPSPAPQIHWNCEEWQAELRAWPVERVERLIAVGPRQRAAFYELAAAIQRAADTLADACPQYASLTPIGRIDDLKKKLEAVRQSVAAIRPALGRFYEALDSSQRSRFNDAV
jgi:hypothetical protein